MTKFMLPTERDAGPKERQRRRITAVSGLSRKATSASLPSDFSEIVSDDSFRPRDSERKSHYNACDKCGRARGIGRAI